MVKVKKYPNAARSGLTTSPQVIETAKKLSSLFNSKSTHKDLLDAIVSLLIALTNDGYNFNYRDKKTDNVINAIVANVHGDISKLVTLASKDTISEISVIAKADIRDIIIDLLDKKGVHIDDDTTNEIVTAVVDDVKSTSNIMQKLLDEKTTSIEKAIVDATKKVEDSTSGDNLESKLAEALTDKKVVDLITTTFDKAKILLSINKQLDKFTNKQLSFQKSFSKSFLHVNKDISAAIDKMRGIDGKIGKLGKAKIATSIMTGKLKVNPTNQLMKLIPFHYRVAIRAIQGIVKVTSFISNTVKKIALYPFKQMFDGIKHIAIDIKNLGKTVIMNSIVAVLKSPAGMFALGWIAGYIVGKIKQAIESITREKIKELLGIGVGGLAGLTAAAAAIKSVFGKDGDKVFKEIEKLRKELEKTKNDVEKIKKEIDEKTKAIEERKREIAEAEKRLEKLEDTNSKKFKELIKDLEKEIKVKNAEIAQLEQEKQISKEQYAAKEEKLNEKLKQFDENLKKQKIESKRELEQTKKELEAKRVKDVANAETKAKTEAETKVRSELKARHTAEIEKLEQHITQKEKTITDLNNRIEDANRRIKTNDADLEKIKTEHVNTIDKIKREALAQSNAALKNNAAQYEAKLARQEAELIRLREQLSRKTQAAAIETTKSTTKPTPTSKPVTPNAKIVETAAKRGESLKTNDIDWSRPKFNTGGKFVNAGVGIANMGGGILGSYFGSTVADMALAGLDVKNETFRNITTDLAGDAGFIAGDMGTSYLLSKVPKLNVAPTSLAGATGGLIAFKVLEKPVDELMKYSEDKFFEYLKQNNPEAADICLKFFNLQILSVGSTDITLKHVTEGAAKFAIIGTIMACAGTGGSIAIGALPAMLITAYNSIARDVDLAQLFAILEAQGRVDEAFLLVNDRTWFFGQRRYTLIKRAIDIKRMLVRTGEFNPALAKLHKASQTKLKFLIRDISRFNSGQSDISLELFSDIESGLYKDLDPASDKELAFIISRMPHQILEQLANDIKSKELKIDDVFSNNVTAVLRSRGIKLDATFSTINKYTGNLNGAIFNPDLFPYINNAKDPLVQQLRKAMYDDRLAFDDIQRYYDEQYLKRAGKIEKAIEELLRQQKKEAESRNLKQDINESREKTNMPLYYQPQLPLAQNSTPIIMTLLAAISKMLEDIRDEQLIRPESLNAAV